MQIGYKIKQRRKELDLTQVELGQRVHKSSQVISNWERGYTTGIVSEDLQELSNALSVPIEYFVSDDGKVPSLLSQSDQRLANLVRVYPNLDEKSKEIIQAIVELHTKQNK